MLLNIKIGRVIHFYNGRSYTSEAIEKCYKCIKSPIYSHDSFIGNKFPRCILRRHFIYVILLFRNNLKRCLTSLTKIAFVLKVIEVIKPNIFIYLWRKRFRIPRISFDSKKMPSFHSFAAIKYLLI